MPIGTRHTSRIHKPCELHIRSEPLRAAFSSNLLSRSDASSRLCRALEHTSNACLHAVSLSACERSADASRRHAGVLLWRSITKGQATPLVRWPWWTAWSVLCQSHSVSELHASSRRTCSHLLLAVWRCLLKACRSVALALDHERTSDAVGTVTVVDYLGRVPPKPPRHRAPCKCRATVFASVARHCSAPLKSGVRGDAS